MKSGKLHRSIKEYPEELRPREKLLALGAEALSDQELLAILLRTGTREKSALVLAEELLSDGGLLRLIQASAEELCREKGMGLAKATQVKAALEIARRLSRQSLGPRPVIKSPADAARILLDEMKFLDREHFRVINLNTKNQVITIDSVSIGSLNAALVHPREVFKLPLKRNAASLILVHNHPSGDPAPSQEDVQLTKRLCEAAAILGIALLDHIIIGNNTYLSMKEKGYISG